MPGPPSHMPGVLGARPGMPAGPLGLLQSPMPVKAGPPGLLGPPPVAAVSVGALGGQGPMDLEEQEFEEGRDSGSDRDRERERRDGVHRNRREKDGDRRSGGRWEDRGERRDRDDRGRDAEHCGKKIKLDSEFEEKISRVTAVRSDEPTVEYRNILAKLHELRKKNSRLTPPLSSSSVTALKRVLVDVKIGDDPVLLAKEICKDEEMCNTLELLLTNN